MTTHVAPQAKDWYQAKETDSGYEKVIGYLPAAHGLTLAQNDTVQMVKVPIGAVVADLVLLMGDIGNSVTPNVGDLVSATRYISAGTVSTGCHLAWSTTQSGVPYTYTAADTIDVVLAGANPADNVAIALIVGYLCGVDITP